MAGNSVILSRDCEATQVPFGTLEVLPAGSRVQIMQSLGGNYTVATEEGSMLRIESRNADALGLASQQPAATEDAAQFSDKLVWETLKTVYDPEIPVNIVDLGLIYSCRITPVTVGHKIEIAMSMTAPGCGMGDVLKADIERRLAKLPEVNEVHVQIVFDPPWHPGLMTEAAKLQLGLDLDASIPFNTYPY
ncbi:MAG: putative Fe-S cluster assembly protein SufT [Acidobacteria bacterium]|nr:putative Fe-S cluster assembly protein SufT [Acidobacteriota bacterium]